MRRKVFTLLLVLSVMFTMCFSTGMAYAAETPEGTPIATLEELKAIENDPYGKYYLTADIEIPEGFTLFKYEYPPKTAFYGTLDGNGHKLIGLTYNHNGGYIEGSALFGKCSGATFKNLTLSGVNINITSDAGMKFGVLTYWADNGCTFENITLEGTVNLNGSADQASYTFGGLSTYIYKDATIKSCKNKMDINAKIVTGKNGYSGASVNIFGLSPAVYASNTIKSCSNTGDITFEGFASSVSIAGVSNASGTKLSSTKNSGDITVTLTDIGQKTYAVKVAGVTTDGKEGLTSCYNTGKIKVSGANGSDVRVAGVACEANTVSKCYNKGAVSLTGEAREAFVGGVVGSGSPSQTYNKGKVSASAKASYLYVGGVAGEIYKMTYCYNTGAVSMSKAGDQGMVGGLAGNAYVTGTSAKYNYNTGKVTGETQFKGSIFGTYSGPEYDMKRTINYNYYTSSAKAYGASGVTWKDWTAKATKVSAITSANCSKLSSKYWTYSKDKKRLILKNNKEK